MRTSTATVLFSLVAAAAIAGCNREEAPVADATPATEAPAPAGDTADVGDDAGVTMRYACDGQRVAVFGQDRVIVTMADGRDIDLAYVADSSPPRFSGEALDFSVAADGAVLAQDEGTTWACTPE